MSTDDRPMTPRRAAAQLGIHVNTIKRIPSSELPYFRVGSRGDRRYDPADVRRYRALRVNTTNERASHDERARHAALVAAAEYGKYVGQWHDAIGSGPIDVLNDELGELRRLCVAALDGEEKA
jgi:hypothetical protein